MTGWFGIFQWIGCFGCFNRMCGIGYSNCMEFGLGCFNGMGVVECFIGSRGLKCFSGLSYLVWLVEWDIRVFQLTGWF